MEPTAPSDPAAPDPPEPSAAEPVSELEAALADRLQRELAALGDERPLVVALDGRSGSGKSTLASAIASRTDAAVIAGDDFYAGGDAEEWDDRTPEDKASRCMDWRRQRPVLEALRRGETATWHAFDWEAPDWDASGARLLDEVSCCAPAPLVLFEGVYSARPELADLVDVRVLLDTPRPVRRRQLLDRSGEYFRADWDRRWGEAEKHYFTTVVAPAWFDLVLVP